MVPGFFLDWCSWAEGYIIFCPWARQRHLLASTSLLVKWRQCTLKKKKKKGVLSPAQRLATYVSSLAIQLGQGSGLLLDSLKKNFISLTLKAPQKLLFQE